MMCREAGRDRWRLRRKPGSRRVRRRGKEDRELFLLIRARSVSRHRRDLLPSRDRSHQVHCHRDRLRLNRRRVPHCQDRIHRGWTRNRRPRLDRNRSSNRNLNRRSRNQSLRHRRCLHFRRCRCHFPRRRRHHHRRHFPHRNRHRCQNLCCRRLCFLRQRQSIAAVVRGPLNNSSEA